MLSGLDIYLRREKDVPKYLIKCVKPEGETELKVADIKVSELSHRESSSSKSSEGSSPSGRPPSENIFANIRTI
jgi:hypothetical protein